MSCQPGDDTAFRVRIDWFSCWLPPFLHPSGQCFDLQLAWTESSSLHRGNHLLDPFLVFREVVALIKFLVLTHQPSRNLHQKSNFVDRMSVARMSYHQRKGD